MDSELKYKALFPIHVVVEQGKTYLWCSCEKSATPPFCDKPDCGSKCISYVAELNEELYFCNCKQTKTPPICDGSHSRMLWEEMKRRS